MYTGEIFQKHVLTLSALIGAALFASLFAARLPSTNETANANEALSEEEILQKPDAPVPPTLSAFAIFIMREKTGQVFFSKNETNPLPIASITKLMTASLALEYLDLFDRVLLTADARKNYDTGEKLSKVPAGETFKMEDALKLAVISSDNDIARALAEAAVAKARPELFSSPFAERMRMFTELMNRKREEIGMADSHFDNPTGIDSSENYSTARDLGRLASFIYRTHPRIWDVSRIAKTDVFSVGGNRYEAITTNPLLEEFPDIVGTKTGSTDGAKESLVLVYNVKTGEPIVIVVLRSDNRLRDARTLIDWLQNAYKF